ncbi:HU family DNA-binding protein [Thermopolyspora sp. NPDC052614]|uniref:HU family DNA-binding protein n=1 Tax=Thermopolyspora sp. NPDC052614 TaxID=3155682 RepID=UPI00341AE7CF
MNKRELVETVAEATKLDKKDVKAVIDATIAAVQVAVAAGDKVTVPGFITAEAVRKPARIARNPQTGQPVEVPETWKPRIVAGSAFKDLVSESKALASA